MFPKVIPWILFSVYLPASPPLAPTCAHLSQSPQHVRMRAVDGGDSGYAHNGLH